MNTRLFFASWLAGLPGVLALALLVLPALIAGKPPALPPWLVLAGATLQSSVLLAVAAAVGARFSGRLGLSAPLLAALIERRPLGDALRPQLLPALAGGLAGAFLFWLYLRFLPPELARLQDALPLPLAARLLYGGITEELLLRWGLMTLLAWALWRGLQRGVGQPAPGVMWAAIVIGALVFGLGHLPVLARLAGPLALPAMLHVLLFNAAFGVIAGWLYWRHGLEAAVLAHALTHLLAVTVPA
ncbi:CPBP family intramembrane glutamic endopeptidase [Derxia lacustris]|uniref:CPBP family intramembrane glutamic endopeptidase n=1 Tax=Derxia lacustris TaxID=764842 RepID=UPI000A172312|nr:CPBP family intramembrane glutamic endopeptidase [Derxia lacustris]